jgi:hypothetical protein
MTLELSIVYVGCMYVYICMYRFLYVCMGVLCCPTGLSFMSMSKTTGSYWRPRYSLLVGFL